MPDPDEFRFAPRVGGELYQGSASRYGRLDLGVGFLPPPGTPTAELTAAASWDLVGGVYLFLGATVRDPAPFVAAVRGLLETRTWKRTRLLWIADPEASVVDWDPIGIALSDAGTLTTITPIPLRNYGVVLDGGLPLRLDAGGPQFTVEPATDGAIRLTVGRGAAELPVVTGAVTIPLSGPAAGCLRMGVRLAVGDEGAAALDALDVGCRFFFDDPTVLGTGLLTSHRYPLFDLATPATVEGAAAFLDLAVQLDPLAPLDPERTSFGFTDPAALRSFYRTNLGSPVDLGPVDARLQFAARPDELALDDATPLYLVPHGRFRLHPPDHERAPALLGGVGGTEHIAPPALLCGVGGAEYIALAVDPLLTFIADHPAYAPDFDPVQTTRLANPGARLTGPVSTAWAAVTADAPPSYFAQPEGAALYGAPTAGPTLVTGTTLLPFFEVPAGALPTTDDPAAVVAYPMVPLAGATADLTAAERLEVQVLSQQRRQVVHGLTERAPLPALAGAVRALAAEWEEAEADPAPLTAATPQGLVATFSADRSRWATLQIAQSGDLRFALRDVTDPLRAALLTNQQFVVVSDPDAFRAYVGDDNELAIAGYRFPLDPGTWSRHSTVLIIKNARKPLVELMADPGTWVLGPRFNRDVAATQRQLQTIVNIAAERAPTEPAFAPFVALLADPAWNGVLVLNVTMPLDGLPKEIGGLTAGIDPDRFLAHHIGVNQTPVLDLVPRDSSLFGLIDYTDQRPTATTGYDFVVRSLTVRFANSLVATFRSQVVLALGEAFGTPLTADPGPTNALVLDGVFQKHGDAGAYVFTENTETAFTAQDSVLAGLRVTGATFATLAAPADAPDTGVTRVETVFSFRGTLAFRALTGPVPVDLFSYDHLAYSDLQLRMGFDPRTPATRTFAFDPAHVRFDVGASQARPDGLAKHFPVTPRGMRVGGGTSRVDSLGILPVDTELDVAPVGTPWFALVHDLNLGSVGALAGDVGLVANLVVAWTPGTGKPAVTVGLKLPGSTGARNAVTVMGVLKLTMFAVRLLVDGRSFLLTLTGVVLSVLGRTLPPGASFDLCLFGDPDPAAGADSLGWYGAFKKDLPAR